MVGAPDMDRSFGRMVCIGRKIKLEEYYFTSGREPFSETYSNLHKDSLMFGSCFNEHCLKSGLTGSPQALLPAELAVVYFKTGRAIAPG
jgi:hypothetical protein